MKTTTLAGLSPIQADQTLERAQTKACERESVVQLTGVDHGVDLVQGEELRLSDDLQILGIRVTDGFDVSQYHPLGVEEERGVHVHATDDLGTLDLEPGFLERLELGRLENEVLDIHAFGLTFHESSRAFPLPGTEAGSELLPAPFFLDPTNVLTPGIRDDPLAHHAEVLSEANAISQPADHDGTRVLDETDLIVEPGLGSLDHLPQRDARHAPSLGIVNPADPLTVGLPPHQRTAEEAVRLKVIFLQERCSRNVYLLFH